ncbi:MAG TPA: alkaline phosphatase family protein [Anaerolineaceae bacterium]|nr:alkaline phosphatase family protein [Anaerolineaceae bacterium]
MPIFDSHLNQLKERQNLPGIQDFTDILLPNYDGFGLANLTPSISRWLGGPELSAPVFSDAILDQFAPKYKRVVLLLVDALGYNQLTSLMEQGQADFWKRNLAKGNLFPITSISPSTTSTALTSLWTGSTPLEHGIIGYEMWVKSLSMVINTILHSPITFWGDVGGLARAGFDPVGFLGIPAVGQQYTSSGIESHAFVPAIIANSGLSKMHHVGTQLHGYTAESDFLANLRDLLNSRPNNRKFVYAYWSHVDSLMHRYGTYNERVTEQFKSFSDAFERILLSKLESWAREDTLFLLTADHGSVETPYNPSYELSSHPELVNLMVMQPTCEGRLPYLYIKPGQEEAVRQYFEHAWPGQFDLITRQQVLDSGLLGRGVPNSDIANRIGDLVAIPHGHAYLWWVNKTNVMLGRHGGLHPDEMLVPLYALSLD